MDPGSIASTLFMIRDLLWIHCFRTLYFPIQGFTTGLAGSLIISADTPFLPSSFIEILIHSLLENGPCYTCYGLSIITSSSPTIIHFLPMVSFLYWNGRKEGNKLFAPLFPLRLFLICFLSELFRVEEESGLLDSIYGFFLRQNVEAYKLCKQGAHRIAEFWKLTLLVFSTKKLIFFLTKYGFLDLFSLTAIRSGSRNGARQ